MKRTIQSLAFVATTAALLGAGSQPASAANVSVTSAIEKSTYWTKNNTYVLDNIIIVRSNATLTVQAGTVIRGQTDAVTPGANNPGTLIVSRGSKLKLLGTEAEPIIFTDMVDDNFAGGAKTAPGYQTWQTRSAQWGGIGFCGRAYVAKATGAGPAATSIQLEGLVALGGDGLYGGIDDDDDSGTIRYISIRYAGFGLAANNELNGLALAGVGRETYVSHVEVLNNLDDALEIWGGTVNIKYFASWNAGDDTLDIDEGYRGKMQFLFGVLGQASATSSTIGGGVSDRGMELDGGNGPDSSQPFGLWKAYNITLVGKGQTGGQSVDYPVKNGNVAIYRRDNSAGQIRNGVFVDFGGWMAHVENEGGDLAVNAQTRFLTAWNGTGYNAPFHLSQTDGNQAEISGGVFYQFGTGQAATSTVELAANAASDASSINQVVPSTNVFLLASNVDNILTPANSPIVSWTREAPGGPAAGVVLNVTSIDPCGANDALTSSLTAPADGFFTPVSYRGAFSSQNNWLKTWTAIDALGLLTSPANPSAPAISIAFNAAKKPVISVPTVNGVLYALEFSDDQKHWSPIQVFTGDGLTFEYVDVSALSARVSYRVVLP